MHGTEPVAGLSDEVLKQRRAAGGGGEVVPVLALFLLCVTLSEEPLQLFLLMGVIIAKYSVKASSILGLWMDHCTPKTSTVTAVVIERMTLIG